MATYILRRVLLVLPTLLGMTLVIFLVMALSPGGISASLISREGTMRPEERKALQDYLNARFGLDLPVHRQYLRWLNKVSPIGFRTYRLDDPAVIEAAKAAEAAPVDEHGNKPKPKIRAGDIIWTRPAIKMPDLGESFVRRRPVIDLIKEALPVTLLLNLISFPLIYAIAILAGIRAARHRGKLFDVASSTIFLGLWSVPTILAGVMFIGFLASEQYLHIFPTNGLHDLLAGDFTFLPHFAADGFHRGWLLDTAWHLVLPIICLSYGSLAILSKLTRGAVLENVTADYARTARAKGVAESNVLYRHVFRNSLLPLITVGAQILPAMLSGSIVVESIFGIAGMGRLDVEAVFMKDPELVLSTAMITGLLGLGGYLLGDILYALADPRVSYDS
jgi:ABC-type dipeptide/oligopeptide/nickel transport system permease component